MDFNQVAACGVGMEVVGVEVGKYDENTYVGEKKIQVTPIQIKWDWQNGAVLSARKTFFRQKDARLRTRIANALTTCNIQIKYTFFALYNGCSLPVYTTIWTIKIFTMAKELTKEQQDEAVRNFISSNTFRSEVIGRDKGVLTEQKEERADTPFTPPIEPDIFGKQTEATVLKRSSNKQRKASLEEYRQTFLTVPKIADRKTVFVSGTVRDRLDEIVRKLGGRRMSVSGLLENLALYHLETYGENIETWKRF